MADPAPHGADAILMLACEVFRVPLEGRLPPMMQARMRYLDYGLHQTPRKLAQTLQTQIGALDHPSLVVLAYGLCGNGLHGLKAGPHTLLVPRMDDCIAMFLGSYAAYRALSAEEPGTYYLTRGWLEAGSDPLAEFGRLQRRYGETKAQWIMDQQFQHYRRLVFVAQDAADLLRYEPRAREVAAYCTRWGMRLELRTGSPDFLNLFAQAIAAAAAGLPLPSDDFLLIPPGGTLQQSAFLRA